MTSKPRAPNLARLLAASAIVAALAGAARADPAPFDLTGPSLTVRVSHAGRTLPVAETAALSAGDQITVKADLPPSQSVHYLLVAAFLRGATNPPPPTWFFKAETWTPLGGLGLRLTVPDGAEQALVFLAPVTGGDFKTIVDAVRGRPGAFVRAAQDLNQASLDRSRLDAFLAAIRRTDQAGPEDLKTVSPLLARTLIIKVDAACLQKMPELQAACLMQGQDSLVLSDGRSASLVQTLSSGSPADLVAQLSNAPHAGIGYYSPYIASLMDIARIMDSLHTAQFQYIPALATQSGDQLSLLLNTPPSFHDPKSVIVAALPDIGPPQPPALHPVDPGGTYCAEKPDLVLPAEGAPLAFSTAYAHDLVLRVRQKNGKTLDLPVKADPARGGLVVDTHGLVPSAFDDSFEGELHGDWGFTPFDGPSFRLQNAHGQAWAIDPKDREALIAGEEPQVRLQGPDAACVQSVGFAVGSGDAAPATWKPDGADAISATAPLKAATPGAARMIVRQYGGETASAAVQVYAPPSKLAGFVFHAGDPDGVLTGERLDQVASLSLGGVRFAPGALADDAHGQALTLTADPGASALQPGSDAASVTLKDGRVLTLASAVLAPRPVVALIDKTVEAAPTGRISLTGADDVAAGSKLTFSIRAVSPARFADDVKVEIAAGDGGPVASLTPGAGVSLADASVLVAGLDTGKAFAGPAFGPLRMRVVEAGAASDWRPLATLVRTPALGALKCPADPAQDCKLSGERLYLVAALSADPAFDHPLTAPDGFTGASLPAPRPAGGKLYLKLRDDPAAIDAVQIGPRGQGRPAPARPGSKARSDSG